MTGGPAARHAVDPAVLVAFLDEHGDYRMGGHPRRNRRHINGFIVHSSDLRSIRRWRHGAVKGVTVSATANLLGWHGFTFDDFVTWATENGHAPMLKGKIPTNPRRTA